MVSNNSYDVIIVGGGPAGLSAGLYSMRAGLNAVLFEKGAPGGQLAISKEVENYPGVKGATGFDLAEKLLDHAQSYGLNIVPQEVVGVEPGQDIHSVRLAKGDMVRTHALILATGGTARKLNIPGEEKYFGRGVSYCATCDGFFFRDRTVAVVGGGDTAVEEALYLSRLAKKVYVVHRRSSLRASRLLQNRLAADQNVEVIWNSIISEIEGDGREVNSLVVDDTITGNRRELAADGIFILIGYSPNSQLVPDGIQLSDRGYVITDDKCESSIPGIFAVGDLRQKFANQIVIAAADGCTAALASARYVDLKKR